MIRKMRKLGLSLGAGLAAVLMGSAAYAVPIAPNGSFGFVPTGSITVNTTNITSATSSKTLPAVETVNTIAATFLGQPNNLGLTLGSAVTLGYFAIPIPPVGIPTGIAPLTVSVPSTVVGGSPLVFTFTQIETLALTATSDTVAGNISLLFAGSLAGSAGFLATAADMSESCTQSGLTASINCSDTVDVPPVRFLTPEPASLLLLGVALGGLGLLEIRRRRSA